MAEIMYVDWDGLVYYDTRSKQYIKDIVDQTIKFGGHYVLEDVPAPGIETLNVAYKITDKFVVSPETAYFLKTCAGKTFEAGTVILVVEDGDSDTYRFDVLFEAYSGAPLTPGGEIDLSNYYTKAQVNDLLSGKVEVEELNKYYLKTETDNKLEDKADRSDLDGLATEEFVATAINAIELPDVSTLATKEELEAVQSTAGSNSVKLFAVESELFDINQKLDELVEPDLSGYATEEFVNKKIAEAELADKEADHEAYYTKSEVDALIPDVSGFANKSDLEGLASKEFVATSINAIEIPDEYVTEEELLAKDFATKDDLTAYAKDEDLSTVSLSVEEIGKTVSKNTADIETLDDAVANNTGAVEALRGEVTEASDKITDLQEVVNNISIPEAELFVVDFNAPDFAVALEAYNNGKLLLLVNAAPDANGYAVMNYVRADLITFTKFLTSRSEAYGSFNTYYLHSDNTWEISKEVKLNKVEANVADEPIAELTSLRVGKEVYSLPNTDGLASTEYVDNAIASIPEVDLTGYATTDELSAVEAKIPSIEGLATETFVTESINNIQPTDLSNYYNKTEVENIVEEAVGNIKVPEVPTNVSAFTNDANYTTLAEVATQGYLTSIPDEYVTSEELAKEGFLKEHQSLEGYVKDAELTDAIEAVEHKIVTKTSELENDAGFVTEGSLPAFVKPDDITDFVTLTEVEEAGFIKSIPDEYVTETELANRQFVTEESLGQKGFITDVSNKADKDHTHSYNDLTDLPTIPSIEGLATKDYVDDAIANIDIPTVDTDNFVTKETVDTLLATKANDVPFLDDYRVGTTLGGFSADESLQGMTVVQILTKLLNLTLYVPPTTDFPEGTPEQAAVVISNEHPVYILGESGEQVKLEYDYTTMSPSEAKRDNQTDTYFYQIIDPETGAAIESGYQIATIYQENDYLTVYLPEAVTNFHVEEYSALAGDWSQPTWKLVENTAYVLDGYKAYTVNAEILSGIAIRVIIEN